MTFGTKTALFKTANRIGTETGDGAAAAIGAVIEGSTKAAGLLEKQVITDFFRNSGTVPAKGSANFFKGSRVIKEGFDSKSFFKG